MLKLTIPEPKNASEAAFQARVLDRALSLSSDGYRWETIARLYYGVFKPGNDTRQPDYRVDLIAMDCTCGGFKKDGFCKHYLAIEKEVLECQQAEEDAENYEGAEGTNDAGNRW